MVKTSFSQPYWKFFPILVFVSISSPKKGSFSLLFKPTFPLSALKRQLSGLQGPDTLLAVSNQQPELHQPPDVKESSLGPLQMNPGIELPVLLISLIQP